jgi:serine/threonine protein kinase
MNESQENGTPVVLSMKNLASSSAIGSSSSGGGVGVTNNKNNNTMIPSTAPTDDTSSGCVGADSLRQANHSSPSAETTTTTATKEMSTLRLIFMMCFPSKKKTASSNNLGIGNTCHPYHGRASVTNTAATNNHRMSDRERLYRRPSSSSGTSTSGIVVSSTSKTTELTLTNKLAVVEDTASIITDAGTDDNEGDPSNKHKNSLHTTTTNKENDNDNNNNMMDSKTMIENLAEDQDPTPDELDGIAALRAKEYIDECLSLSTDVSAMSSFVDRTLWESIPQYTKLDLIVGQHLGKGTFSDVFEVIASVLDTDYAPEKLFPPTRESLNMESADLDKLIQKKFHPIQSSSNNRNEGASEEEEEETETEDPILNNNSTEQPPNLETNVQDDDHNNIRATRRHSAEDIARPSTTSSSIIDESSSSGLPSSPPPRTSRTLAMKCLRPQNRSNMDQFMIGVEDLVNETAMLASLQHPNIITLHGRAGGCGGSGTNDNNSLRLSDGFFILLDRLKDTLDDRIKGWKKISTNNKGGGGGAASASSSTWASQIKTACAIADAMSYLHTRNIVFRDLKPTNVGFNSSGVVKLFDFGFAIRVGGGVSSISDGDDNGNNNTPNLVENGEAKEGGGGGGGNGAAKEEEEGTTSQDLLLYERCGTVRYMAPEVGLDLGYSLPSDVYSYGMLLWEICSLKKPFDTIKTTVDFENKVFKKGMRPKLSKDWSIELKDVMTSCWTTEAKERPSMLDVKTRMHQYAHARWGGGGGGGGVTATSSSSNNAGRGSLFRKMRRSTLY